MFVLISTVKFPCDIWHIILCFAFELAFLIKLNITFHRLYSLFSLPILHFLFITFRYILLKRVHLTCLYKTNSFLCTIDSKE